MRKHAISAALLGILALAGCQAFTAGETVTEPDPVAVREAAERAARAKSGGQDEAKQDRPNPHAGANPHGAPNPHGRPNPHGAGAEAAKEAAPGEQAESATASHILIRYAGAMRTTPDITRTKEEAKKLAQQVARKARAPGADFTALANEYSEDPSGKGRGGKLGTFPKGRMVREFDEPLFAMSPGQVSDVIETPFGFHIIHREN